MDIKKNENFEKFLKKIKFDSSLIFPLICLAMSFMAGAIMENNGTISSLVKPILNFNLSQSFLGFPKRYIDTKLHFPQKILIDIKHENYQKIAAKRKIALEKGILDKSLDDWVNAIVSHKGKSLEAKIRLKGLGRDHWDDDEVWSLDIKIKGNNTIFGMKRFAIQHPKTRNFMVEWVAKKLFKYAGLFKLHYEFISVSINGKEERIYAIEDRGNKQSISENSLREGLLFKIDNDFRSSSVATELNAMNATAPLFYEVEFEPVNKQTIQKNSSLSRQYQQARNLIESFRLKEVAPEKVFDLKKMGLFFAIVDLFGFYHAAELANIKFYYNPITSLIEPIGNDINQFLRLDENRNRLLSLDIKEKSDLTTSEINSLYFYKLLFSDEVFFKEYIRNLDYIANTDFLDRFFLKNKEETFANLSILRKDNFLYNFNGKEILSANRDYIKGVLNLTNSLRAYWYETEKKNGETILKVRNVKSLPIEILGVRTSNNELIPPINRTLIPGYENGEPLQINKVAFPNIKFSNQKVSEKKLSIVYRLPGSEKVFTNFVFMNLKLDDEITFRGIINFNHNKKHKRLFFYDEKNKIISFRTGGIELNETLIIPPGYIVKANSGVTINLKNSASIISRSPLKFIGSKNIPIIIKSEDSSGGGLAVLNAKNPSFFEYVDFFNLSNPTEGLWEITGAVTFYKSDVKILNSKFKKNRSEDALNVISSDLYFENISFEDTKSDAFDGDFITGIIKNSFFEKCGNDCIDVSGSKIKGYDINIDGANDKGLSVGEKSYLEGNRLKLKNTNIGIASKDFSKAKISNLKIIDSKVGLATYQKKPEYGGGEIEIDQIDLENVEKDYLIEKGSSIKINKEKIISQNTNVLPFL